MAKAVDKIVPAVESVLELGQRSVDKRGLVAERFQWGFEVEKSAEPRYSFAPRV